MRRNKDKIAVARSQGQGALSLFRDAYDQLVEAMDLLDVAADEHDAVAAEAAQRAAEARNLRGEHDRAARKISEFIGQ